MTSAGTVLAEGRAAAFTDVPADVGRHNVADGYLRAALNTAVAFGWEYHRATTLIALAQSRLRRTGALDPDASALLAEADAICLARRLRSWAKHIETLLG